MKNKFILLFAICILLISFTSSYTWKTQPQNSCVNLTAICPLSDCNYTKFDFITLPNGTLTSQNALATHNNNSWWLNFCITDNLGVYVVNGYSTNSSEKIYFEGDFKVTPSGKESTTAEAILYFVMVIVMLSLITILFFFILSLPFKNERDESGNITGIVKLKYLKIFFISLLYPMIIVLLNLINGLANNFTTLSIFAGQIGFIEELLLRLAWPFFVLIAIWIIYLLIRDTNHKKLIKAGGYING